MPDRPELKRYYDVVIVGGGSHGLATAYGLRRRGITDVAILERGSSDGVTARLARGAAAGGAALLGSEPEILRATGAVPGATGAVPGATGAVPGATGAVPGEGRRHDCDAADTVAGVRLYDASLALYESLTRDLGLPLSPRASLTLAQSASTATALAHRAQVARLKGREARFVAPEELERLVPAMRASAAPPVAGALHHPRGGLVQRAAVVRALARGAGAELHPHTAVTGLERRRGRIVKVRTSRGDVEAGVVLGCAGPRTAALAALAGVQLPVTTYVVQACLTEPVPPLLDVTLASARVSLAQTDGGALLMGAEPQAPPTGRAQTTLEALRETTHEVLERFPQLEHVRVTGVWAALCDLGPGPIAGRTDVENLHLSAGWGTCGITVAPIVGKMLAELVDTGRTPELIAPYALERFHEGRLVPEPAPRP